MAEWKHKQADWHQSDSKSCVIRDGYIQYVGSDYIDTYEDVLGFPEWLDYHCDGGWEVFKIIRSYNTSKQREEIWCIFRTLV